MITLQFSECQDGQKFYFLDRTGEAVTNSLLVKATAHITTEEGRADSRNGYTYLAGDMVGHFFQVRTDFRVGVESIRPSASERIAARKQANLAYAQKRVDNLGFGS
jgi:hypothetical protein